MKHVLREKMIELRPKIRNLTLGEMMFLLSIDYILDVKIKEVTKNYQRILECKKDIPLIEVIFCYVRDVYIAEKENLKEVLEELLVRKAKFYLSQLLLVHNERLQMSLVEKDFTAILQSSCSINKIYMKVSQIFLKEFIREFPILIFQDIVMLSISETLEFLCKRVLQQYDSVSSRLKISHYNLRIAIPDTLKDINDLLVFLLACTHSMCLRGYLIESHTFLKRINDHLTLPQLKNMKHVNLIFQYFFWSYNNHPSLVADFQIKGAAYWFYDKPYFLSKVERFENKHLDEGLKVISVIPPFSFEIHFDSKLIVNSLNQTLREFKHYSGNQLEIQLFKEKIPPFSKIFEDLKTSLIQFYIFSQIQREKNYKLHLSEMLKDLHLLKVFDKEAREIISSTATKNVNIVDKIKTKMDETYSNVVSCLQFAALCIKADPTQAFNILTKIYTLILSLPAKKIMKFVIKKLTKNVLSLISNKYSSDVLRALFFMFQEIIFRYNSYTNISATTKPKFYEFDLLEVNSDIFSKIKFKDLVAHNSSHLQLHEKLSENFLSYNEQKGLIIKQVRSLFSIRHFIREFNSAHKDIMIFIYRNLSLFLANMIDPFEMIIFLRENFHILQTSIEFLRDENIFAIISVHFSVLNLLKNSPLPNIERRFLQKFYSKSLKFALSYFAKNTRFYVDETFESQHKILKIEKKMDLALKACRYLKFETFMETTLTSEKN